jgi:hypothetical protein
MLACLVGLKKNLKVFCTLAQISPAYMPNALTSINLLTASVMDEMNYKKNAIHKVSGNGRTASYLGY